MLPRTIPEAPVHPDHYVQGGTDNVCATNCASAKTEMSYLLCRVRDSTCAAEGSCEPGSAPYCHSDAQVLNLRGMGLSFRTLSRAAPCSDPLIVVCVDTGLCGEGSMLPLIIASGLALAQNDGCSKDADCKGDRICENRVCVSPQPSRSEPVLPVPTPAQATLVQPHEASSPHRHRGLFLRPDIGFGYLTASMSDLGGDYTMSGAAAYLGFAIGGSVADGVILAGHLWGMGATSPNITANGQGGAPGETRLGFAAIGPEFDYYFMPANLFLGATLALSRFTLRTGGRLTSGGTDYSTQVGLAGQFGVGKEWWVSDSWGLGLKGEVTITANKDNSSSNPPTWMGFAFAVGFSATYN